MDKRLYRSRTERTIAGVCGGLAAYFELDPTIVRIAFVVLALLGGPGILLYVILWIVFPEEPVETAVETPIDTPAEPPTEE
jgi:phage shock protein C